VPQIDLSGQYTELRNEIDSALARVIQTNAFVGGEVIDFEREFADYLGVDYAVGVANGTDALEIALQALGIGSGDEVLLPAFTFVATLEAVVRVGATPVLTDIGEDYTLDLDATTRQLETGRVKAVLPVHLYGQPADMEPLLSAARRHGAVVVEDAAQAHGARCTVAGRSWHAGTMGAAGCFSFYPTKNLGGMGDGGAVVTNDERIAARVRLIANHGERGKYDHVRSDGRNSRLDALQAAVLRRKLPRLDIWNARRRQIAADYSRLLADLPLRLPPERPDSESVYHQYAVRADDRDALRDRLADQGVGSAVHYPKALHQIEAFHHLFAAAGRFPLAERAAREVLSLPMFPHLSSEQVRAVSHALHEAC
jgi:dTDP-4-amino-4,6-dideoxygalactose transaminase